MPCRIHKGGFTLIELIVVVAIISILTAIAVPTMGKLGMFGRDPLSTASTQLLYMLKAARIYAGANNVDTAVVYSIGMHKGPQTSTGPSMDILAIDGIAIVRRLTSREWDLLFPALQVRLANRVNAGTMTQAEADWQLAWVQQGSEKAGIRYLPFVPVKDTNGVFTPLSRGAVLAQRDTNQLSPTYGMILGDDNHLPDGTLDNTDNDRTDEINGWGAESWGLLPIRVVDYQLNPFRPRLVQITTVPPPSPLPPYYTRLTYDYMASGYDNLPDRFPAHVFKPSGVLETSDSAKARFQITVIPAPEAPQNARFLDSGEPVPAEALDIYSTIGRIQAAS